MLPSVVNVRTIAHQVHAIDRNRCAQSIGITARLRPESVRVLGRNTHFWDRRSRDHCVASPKSLVRLLVAQEERKGQWWHLVAGDAGGDMARGV